MRKYQREPTRSQWVMIACVLVIVVALIIFGVWEIRGIIDPAPEDTFSEWVWDLDLWAVILFSGVSILLGVIVSWFAIHVWEGWILRRRRERTWEEQSRRDEEGEDPPPLTGL